MKNNPNVDYVIKNLGHNGNVVDWLCCIENFFGKEQAEAFCEYFISVHHILEKDDIRNIIVHNYMSVFSNSCKEQIAFISNYTPINTTSPIIKNMENGLKRAQEMYRTKSIDLSKEIKQLGYSYSTTWGNWKDKNIHDTYQREHVFLIYSEKDTNNQFKSNIINLAKKYNINSVLITENIANNEPKLQIKSKLYDVKNQEIIVENEYTTIETVEKYLSNLSNTKVLFNIPYEKNKTILQYDDNKISDYYSLFKQEKIKKCSPLSYNTAMLKHFLLNSFSKENYNT